MKISIDWISIWYCLFVKKENQERPGRCHFVEFTTRMFINKHEICLDLKMLIWHNICINLSKSICNFVNCIQNDVSKFDWNNNFELRKIWKMVGFFFNIGIIYDWYSEKMIDAYDLFLSWATTSNFDSVHVSCLIALRQMFDFDFEKINLGHNCCTSIHNDNFDHIHSSADITTWQLPGIVKTSIPNLVCKSSSEPELSNLNLIRREQMTREA